MFTKKFSIIICLILFFMSLCITPWAAESKVGTATGTFTWNGQTHQIKYAYAAQTEAPFDENKKDAFLVVLADAPVTKDVSKLHRFDMRRLFEGKNLHGIVFGIDSNNDVFFTDIPGGFNGSGIAVFEPGKMKPELIEGRTHTNGMKELGGDTYGFDISFQAAVQTEKVIDAKNGIALPKEGGEPGKAYIAYTKALESGDFESMIKLKEMTSDQLEKVERMKKESPEALKQQMVMISKLAKKNIKILEGHTNGSEAMLTVEGVDPLASKSIRGKVEMKLVNGQWKVVDEKWDAAKLN